MSIASSMTAKERKEAPVYSGFIRYFPDAMIAVAQLSRIGNEQHNPGKPLHWDRSKSGDELDALTRHLIDAEGEDGPGHKVPMYDTDNVLHATKVAWRAMANLQKMLEAQAAQAMPTITKGTQEGPYVQTIHPFGNEPQFVPLEDKIDTIYDTTRRMKDPRR